MYDYNKQVTDDIILTTLKEKAYQLSEYNFMVWAMKYELFSTNGHAQRFFKLRQEEKNKGSFFNESNQFDITW